MRLGIRGRILGFYGATLLFVLAIELVVQGAAARSSAEFSRRLERYHALQEFRSSLVDFRRRAESYLRDRLPEQAAALEEDLPYFSTAVPRLAPLEDEGQDAFLEQRAVRRGMEAWAPLVRESLSLRSSGSELAGQVWAKADRIAAHVDTYLDRLLSLALASGSSSYRLIASRNAENARLALIGILGGGALALAFVSLMAASIAAPIRHLAEAADRMSKGDLDVEEVPARSGDEVEVLARGFTVMAANIRAMVEGLREKAELQRLLHEESLARAEMGRALREAQYLHLQDQIRPHFLFNALNTIVRSASFEEAPTTERLARGLAKLMRYSLAEGGGLARLDEELDHLREYLAFQSIRFGKRLGWEVRAEPGLEDLRLPRYTLQPLVENAVRHGIERRIEGGRVLVDARRHRGRLRLAVLDSGTGIEAEVLARIRSAAAGFDEVADPASGRPGIGLANILARLSWRHGGDVRFGIVSRPGRGTLVRISLPLDSPAQAAP